MSTDLCILSLSLSLSPSVNPPCFSIAASGFLMSDRMTLSLPYLALQRKDLLPLSGSIQSFVVGHLYIVDNSDVVEERRLIFTCTFTHPYTHASPQVL